MCKIIEYKVNKGDTLCKISKKYNIPIKKIAELNGITNIDFIKEGDILILCQ